jgi:hypothetical protein
MSDWNELGDAGLTEFFIAYRAAFKNRDAETLAGCFSYPCLLTSDLGGSVRSRSVADAEAYKAVAGMVIELYDRAGAIGGAPLWTSVIRVSEAIALVEVRWRIRSATAPLYDFGAIYTLVRTGAGWRICAIAQDEIPKLQAAAERSAS